MDPSFLLDPTEVQERLQKSGSPWKVSTNEDGHATLEKTFVARNFQAALNALNDMGKVAEEQNHHPDFHLTEYRTVRIVVWTHKLQGLTESDVTLTQLLDEVPGIVYSPKWLREHPEYAGANDTTSSES
eukprot:CAMPEP_0172451896 /NCGR_PEP_ID=MMETSP1065-20121228/9730_1 /TAXON_ID=265537 /ORGANISM="Amphiprora paludosa, Strain CCMP125" /LENGTH=128 /DNA_ID=CAMNT_0013203867 /DNA_START=168 /DNA_END=554 /DNA_ORIENTATION=+